MNADATDSLAAVLAAHEASWWGFGSYIKCSCAAWRSLVTDEDDAGLHRAHVADLLAQAVAANKAEAVAYWKGRAQEAWRREDRLANDLLIASSDKAEAVRAGRAEGRLLGVRQMRQVLFCSEHGEPYCQCQVPLRDELHALVRAEAEQGDGE